jgi:HSP20 family protein
MAQENTREKGKAEGDAASTQGMQKAPAGRVLAPFDEMDRLFDRMLPRNWLRPMRFEWPAWAEHMAPFEGKTPHVDIIDREAEIVIRAELPGVKKDDLDVSLSDNSVTIRGTMKKEETEEKGEYYRREMSYGEFSRTLALPSEVDRDKAKAKFKDGVLELTLPKAETAKRNSIRIETE